MLIARSRISLAHRFGEPTRLVAALVSAIGYAGFTGTQLLAGGKLASAAFEFDLTTSVLAMSCRHRPLLPPSAGCRR